MTSRRAPRSPNGSSQVPAIFAYYVGRALLPLGLAATPHPAALDGPGSADFPLAVALCAGFAAALWLASTRRPAVGLGLWLFALGLLPVSGLVSMKLPILEHRSYVPFAGLALAVAAATATLAPRPKQLAAGAGVLLAGGLALVTWQRLPVYRDDAALWAAAAANAPRSAYARGQHGAVLLQQGDAEAARTHLLEALKQSPESRDVRLNLALALGRTGREAAAERQLRVLVRRDPSDLLAVLLLEDLMIRSGRPGFGPGPRGFPAEAWEHAGRQLARGGATDPAERAFRRARAAQGEKQ